MKCNYYSQLSTILYLSRQWVNGTKRIPRSKVIRSSRGDSRCNSISRSGNRNRDYDTCLYRKYPFPFLFFFFKYCVYTYIFFSFTCFFRHVRREIAWLGRNRSFSLAFKKSLRKETAVAPILSFSSLEDINETVSRFNRNDEISIRFPGSKQDPILLSTMFA